MFSPTEVRLEKFIWLTENQDVQVPCHTKSTFHHQKPRIASVYRLQHDIELQMK